MKKLKIIILSAILVFTLNASAQLTVGNTITITGSGNVGINNPSPSYTFDVTGTANIGGTNRVALSELSAVRLYGTTKVWNDIAITGLNSPGGATAATFTTGWAGSSLLGANYFQGSAADDKLYFVIQVPHNVSSNDSMEIHFHWGCTTTPVAGDTAVFRLTYTFANIGTTFPAATTGVIVKIPLNGKAQWGHELTEVYVSANGTGTLSRIFNCVLERLASSNSSDTYTSNIGVLSIDAHALIDKLGSDKETSNY